jgi:DNA-binding winged helix-turn-helix (wHTH) protein
MRLRRKLEAGRSSPRQIETERNVGYVFTPTVEIVDLRVGVNLQRAHI